MEAGDVEAGDVEAGECEACGTTVDVRAVNVATSAGRTRTLALCTDCKARQLARRRVRAPVGKPPGSLVGRLRAVTGGGPLGYLGLVLLVAGAALVPLLVVVSLFLR